MDERKKRGREKENLPVSLPEEFLCRMEQMLGSEYPAFRKAFEKEKVQGLRLNTLKGSREELYDQCRRLFGLVSVPWCSEGFYYEGDDRPGRHPFHQAGVYYIQEPSAMAVVSLLDPQPGDMVLDLCAAPGGKTTHAAARMAGKGLLVSNEIHPARAKILSQNVERMGIKNAVVINEDPEKLKHVFPVFFDKIIIDAPCSGEGMFRKDEQARTEWSRENLRLCAARQQQILDHGAKMLKPGGRMVYSTCTFSPEENEEGIIRFLESHPDFFLAPVSKPLAGMVKGRRDWWSEEKTEWEGTFRIWPHLARGEGHFAALLEKRGEGPLADVSYKEENPGKAKRGETRRGDEGEKLFLEFWTKTISHVSPKDFGLNLDGMTWFGEQLYQVPEGMFTLDGLRILRPGLHLGTLKKNRFEPSHGLALTLSPDQVDQCLRLDISGTEIMTYLAGGALSAQSGQKGWVLMCAGNYSLGWAKAAGGILKNHYPKGLRIN